MLLLCSGNIGHCWDKNITVQTPSSCLGLSHETPGMAQHTLLRLFLMPWNKGRWFAKLCLGRLSDPCTRSKRYPGNSLQSQQSPGKSSLTHQNPSSAVQCRFGNLNPWVPSTHLPRISLHTHLESWCHLSSCWAAPFASGTLQLKDVRALPVCAALLPTIKLCETLESKHKTEVISFPSGDLNGQGHVREIEVSIWNEGRIARLSRSSCIYRSYFQDQQ